MLVLNDAAGVEDQAIALNLAAGLSDLDGSESLSVTISGLPEGAVLSAGVDNLDGSWSLSGAELSGLTITPPADSDVDFALTVAATATEAAGGSRTVTGTVNVSVAADADAPVLVLNDAAGVEDQAIPLDISLALSDVDGSESLSGDIILTGVPEGAVLNIGAAGAGGTWVIAQADLAVTASNEAGDAIAWNIPGLAITPPANSDVDFELGVRVTIQDGADSVTNEGSLMVQVAAEADGPAMTAADVAGDEDTAIALDFGATLIDTDGSEVLGDVIISGVPEGAVLSAGVLDAESGLWTLGAGELDGLTVTPPENYNGELTLTATAASSENDGGRAEASATATVTVNAVADAPELAVEQSAIQVEGANGVLHLMVAMEGRDDHGRGHDKGHGKEESATFQVHVDGKLAATITTNVVHGEDGEWDNITISDIGLDVGAGHTITISPEHGNDTILVKQIAYNDVVLEAGSDGVLGDSHGHHHHRHEDDARVVDDFVRLDNHGQVSFGISNMMATVIASEVAIADVDSDQLSGAVIRIADGMESGDFLDLAGFSIIVDADGRSIIAGTGVEVVGGGFDAETGQLTLAGAADLAVYDEILSAVQLNNSSPGERQIDFVVTDDSGESSLLQSVNLEVIPGSDGEGGIGNLIIGGDGDDRLGGTRRDDVMRGGDGDDRMNGNRGDDVMDGGDGDDRMNGNRGDDVMDGGAGDDRMHGNRGDDVMDGGAGDDRLHGGHGDDVLSGGDGDDLLRGGAGDDQLAGGRGDDRLHGDAGNDTFTFGADGGYDFVKGGRGWTDGVRLENVNGGPVDEIRAEGDWTLNTDYSYTTEGNTLVFGDDDAAGMITLWDGTQVEFEEISTIAW